MEEKQNFFIRAWSFIKFKMQAIQESREICRELSENEEVNEYKENVLKTIKNSTVLLVIFGGVSFVVYWVIKLGIILFSAVTGFLIRHTALKLLAIACLFALVLAIIFGKKKTEILLKDALELESEYQSIRNRLFQATLVNSDLGLAIPSNEGELSTPNNIPYEKFGEVYHNLYIWKKNPNFEGKVNLNAVKRNIMTTFRQFQRDLKMPSMSPHGVMKGGKYYPSILVMSVEDNIDYVTLKLALADDYSIGMYEQSTPYKDKIDTKDVDF